MKANSSTYILIMTRDLFDLGKHDGLFSFSTMEEAPPLGPMSVEFVPALKQMGRTCRRLAAR